MQDKPLPHPVTVTFGGMTHAVATVNEAYRLLTEDWPEEARGDRHADAVGACLKVQDGHRSAVDAEDALKEAAREAGMTVA